MAQARMLNRSVAIDERLNGMSQAAMLFYLMSVPHLDRDGLIDGRPRVLWAQVAPLQDAWLTTAGALVDEWVECGLVVRYGDGKPVLFFPGFQKNQPRMVYRREQVSQFPCPPGYVRTDEGLEPIGAAGALAVGTARDEVESGSREYRDEVASSSRVGRDEVATYSRAHRVLGATSARPSRAEDQDQDQSEVEVDVDDGRSTTTATTADGFSNNARARAYVREIEVLEDGSLALTPAGHARARLREGQHMTPGDMMCAFSHDQVRRIAWEMGALVGLHTEWQGFERWLKQQEYHTLWELIWWCQFYADLSPEKLDAIKSLPGIIRSNLNDHVRAPLSGRQRQAVAQLIDRLEQLEGVEA